MVVTKTVKIKISSRTFQRFKDFGYVFKMGDEIEVKVEHLSKGSQIKVDVQCDECGNEKTIKYEYYRTAFDKRNFYYCKNCRTKAIKIGTLEKHGVENVFQLEAVKEKIKETNLDKFGVEYPLQNPEILEKQKKTNMELYGVEFQMQSHKFLLETFQDQPQIYYLKSVFYSLVFSHSI